MNNPFDIILSRIQDLETMVNNIPPTVSAAKPEIINTQELCNRLNITEPTIIKWRRKKKIPFIQIGKIVRYNWPSVVKSLEK